MRRPQNLKKISHLYLFSSVKTSRTFFKNFVAFSEKLNFTDNFQRLTTSLIDFQPRTGPLAAMFLVFIESHPSWTYTVLQMNVQLYFVKINFIWVPKGGKQSSKFCFFNYYKQVGGHTYLETFYSCSHKNYSHTYLKMVLYLYSLTRVPNKWL